jgi:hypothetical protein
MLSAMYRVRQFAATLAVVSFAAVAFAQKSTPDLVHQFVIDNSKPYVYIKFDHIGDRKPVKDGESSRGLWLRLVNNRYLPIKVRTFGFGTGDPGVGVDFDVVRRGIHIISNDEPRGEPPFGYVTENADEVTILPKKDLLFSVPAESVTKAWYIQVRFNFDLPEPKHGYHPYGVADFTWWDTPEEIRSSHSSAP